MLVDIKLIEPWHGVSAGNFTQVDEETANKLIADGIAEIEKKTEPIKKGK